MEVLKVSARSNPNSVAGALAGVLVKQVMLKCRLLVRGRSIRQ